IPASPTEVEFYRDTYPELALLHRRHIMDAATTKLVVPGVDEPCDVLVMPIGIPLSKLAMGLSENLCTYNRVTDNPMYEAEKAGEDDAAVAERFGAFITRKLPVFGTDGRDKEQRFCAQLAALSAIHDMLMIAKARKDQGHFPTDLKLHNMLLDAVRRTLEIDVADQVAFGTASDGVVKGTIAFASPHQMIRGSELSDQALLWMVGQSALTLLLNGTPLNSLLRPEIVHADIATFQYINTCMKGSQSPDQDTLFHPLGDARLQRLFALMFTTVSPANDAHDTPHIHGTGTLAILRFVQSFIYYPQAMHTQPSVPPVFLDFEGKEQPYPTSIEEAIAALLPLRRNMLHKLNTQHPAGITLPVPQTGNEEESRTVTVYTIHDCVNYQLLCAGAIQLEEAFETDSSPKLCHEKERPLRIHATIALC
ncbi:MAG: hypothetical protein O3A01_06595, partial [bacterium]|nr:hypothetical protein [bacterium]